MGTKKKKKQINNVGEILVCKNAKARRLYKIEERMEAGMVLMGSEVKSLRARQASLDGAYASVDQGELFLHHMHIAVYEQAGIFGHQPKRSRKLLAHKREIERLIGKLEQRGYTLVPLRVYFRNRHAKIELGLGKGLQARDTREDIKRKLDLRETRSAMERVQK